MIYGLKENLLDALFRNSKKMLDEENVGLQGGWLFILLIIYNIRKLLCVLAPALLVVGALEIEFLCMIIVWFLIIVFCTNTITMLIYGLYKKYYTFCSIIFLELVLVFMLFQMFHVQFDANGITYW